jgi:hypothetical protein
MLVLGAALEDATPAQRKRMKKRGRVLTEQLRETGDVRPFYLMIHEVHGPAWRPTGARGELLSGMEG